MRRLLAALVLALPLAAPPAAAADLHRLFEDRCQSCHGHAGDFARNTLTVVDGHATARRPGGDLARFLERHGGGLPPPDARAVAAMLEAAAVTPPVYQQRCRSCHDRAADFARAALVSRDGVLVGRFTGRPVAAFLASHGRLSDDEAAAMLALLTRVEREVHGP